MRKAFMSAVLLAGSVCYAEAATYQEYGVPENEALPPEAQRYGGWPSNKIFNNETSCRAVLALFGSRNPDRDLLQAFLSYSRASLMIMDKVTAAMTHSAPAIETIGMDSWRALPAFIQAECRFHSKEKLGDALLAVYQWGRTTHGLKPAP